jgi:hypothetical protein
MKLTEVIDSALHGSKQKKIDACHYFVELPFSDERIINTLKLLCEDEDEAVALLSKISLKQVTNKPSIREINKKIQETEDELIKGLFE